MEKIFFNSLNNYFKKTFGEKVYKLSIDAGFTCPNRDGKISEKGCIFCSENGSGDFTGNKFDSITKQIISQKKFISSKFNGNKYVAYFQNFTNTYANVQHLRKIYYEALSNDDIIGIAIATRPDCLDENVLNLLEEINKKYFMWIELGLQTSNDKVANWLNRGYPTKTYIDITKKLQKRNIKFVTHIIVGLPFEEKDDYLKTAILSNKCGTWGIKIHLLYLVKGTIIAEYYEKEKFELESKESYVKKVVDILEHISPDIVVHRLTGDGNKNELLAPMWSTNKKDVLNSITKEFKIRSSYQGKFFKA